MNTMQTWHIADAYGTVDKLHPHGNHGVDFAVHAGTPLQAINDGYVQSVGRVIRIHGYNGYDVIYRHVAHSGLRVGDAVKAGQTIGTTADHFRLQVIRGELPIDPMRYMSDHLAAWWDVDAHGQAAINGFRDWWESGVLHFVIDTLSWGLPTLAGLGVLWWMFPFAPRGKYGIRLAAFSLVVYLFYSLVKGAYLGVED